MKQRICWTFVIPCRKAKNAWVNILWLWSLDTINKGKNKYDSRPPTTFSNYVSSYYFPYWKGTLGFDVLGMLYRMLLLLLLSHFSCVRLCVTPSLGFSRQEHWSGLPFPSPMHESEQWKWSCSAMSDSSWPHGLQPTRLLRPWDFPGKSTGVGCHCLSDTEC